jgi:molybdopterin converting factor small subunit
LPQIRVEFLGVARARAASESVQLEATTVGDVIEQLAERFPQLANTCFDAGSLRSGWLFSIDGRVFTRTTSEQLVEGTSLLLLSADAGG